MIMKKHIILLGFFALCITAQSQTLILVNGDSIKFEKKELKRIVPIAAEGDAYDMNKIDFVTSSQTRTFDIRDLKTLRFADDYISGITEIVTDETKIYYDSQEQRVIIANGKEDATLKIYNPKGVLVKSGTGCELSVTDLAAGLYIVCYDDKLNVKIMKK